MEREVEWPYAYFELAQRDVQADGRRFEGFFSKQVRQLANLRGIRRMECA